MKSLPPAAQPFAVADGALSISKCPRPLALRSQSAKKGLVILQSCRAAPYRRPYSLRLPVFLHSSVCKNTLLHSTLLSVCHSTCACARSSQVSKFRSLHTKMSSAPPRKRTLDDVSYDRRFKACTTSPTRYTARTAPRNEGTHLFGIAVLTSWHRVCSLTTRFPLFFKRLSPGSLYNVAGHTHTQSSDSCLA